MCPNRQNIKTRCQATATQQTCCYTGHYVHVSRQSAKHSLRVNTLCTSSPPSLEPARPSFICGTLSPVRVASLSTALPRTSKQSHGTVSFLLERLRENRSPGRSSSVVVLCHLGGKKPIGQQRKQSSIIVTKSEGHGRRGRTRRPKIYPLDNERTADEMAPTPNVEIKRSTLYVPYASWSR